MGLWDLYFITKLFLYFGKHIGFHAWPNFALAIFLILPIPENLARRKLLVRLRQAIAIPAGIALFYYDTWLPPITTVFSKAGEVEGFSFTYLQELAGRFFNPWVTGGLVLTYILYFFVAKRIRISSVIFVLMLAPLFSLGQGQPQPETSQVAASAFTGPADSASLNTQLDSFFERESTRSVSFTPPSRSDAPFDVIIIQICSFSWDDIDFSKEKDNPLFKRFNIVFTHFNSAASYSGPAAIRLLRGSCGQPRHKQLYDSPLPQCLTFENLKNIGFSEQLAMNHNGVYGGFLNDVRVRGGLQAKLADQTGLPTYLLGFDGSPIHDDLSTLTKWWNDRLKSSAPRVALFYNTISLHDGDYYPGRKGSSQETYPARMDRLLKDMDSFFSLLQASGRHAVVVFVAEHGAAMRGDKMQIAGLREIPTPRITTVPAAIKLIGIPDNPAAKPLLVDQQTSYLGLTQLLANFIAVSPFGKNSLSMEDYTHDLARTDLVSENEDELMMQRGKRYYMRAKGQDWIEYDPNH